MPVETPSGPARPSVRVDRMLIAGAWLSVLVLVGICGLLVADLLRIAWPRLGLELFTTPASRSGRSGGLTGIMVSTAAAAGLALAVALPVAVATALVLARHGGPAASVLRVGLDLLNGVPSIVLGLFGLLVFGDLLGLGFSIASGGLTLAVMLLPVQVRLLESALRAVPMDLQRAAAGAGLSRSRALVHLVLPAVLPALGAATALGLARALAETAALVFTIGGSLRAPTALTDPGRTLAVHIYELAMNVAGGEASAAAAALVLMAAVAGAQVATAMLLPRRTRRAP